MMATSMKKGLFPLLAGLLAAILLGAGCANQEPGNGDKAAGSSVAVPAPVSAKLAAPAGMALDRHGNLYVSEPLTGRVCCIKRDGTATVVADGLEAPNGLCLDRDGNLLVAETGAGRIVRIAPDGTRRVLAGD